jgi:apolipoprotein N-acyltransferase
VEAIAERVLLLWGWRRLALAALAGGIAALALPPLNLLPALAVAFPLAVWLIDGATQGPGRFAWRTLRAAFAVGWAFGFGYFLAGFWWIGAAFTVETDEFIWLMPFGVLGLPAGLALFHGLGFMLARMMWSGGGRRVFAFAAAMAMVEWLRSWVLTGFPWNSLGQAFGAFDATAQAASIVCLHGLTLLALLIFASFAPLGARDRFWPRWRLPLLALSGLAAMAAFGQWRIMTTPVTMLPDVRLRIMQPNISQREKHRLTGQEVLARYLALSDRAAAPGASGIADVTHLMWPESPFPFLLAREPQALGQIAALLRPRTTLITGAARAEDAGVTPRYFNSMHVIGPDGVISDSYDKTHLVPFGEYLPLKGLFAALGLRQFVEIPGGFEPGARRRLLAIKGLPPALPLICYEAIFPSEAAYSGPRPGLIINVTNDGWFGITTGPHQHLAQARLRSIEQGLPLIRAANTGISAVIDPLGRITASLALGTAGVIDAQIPLAVPPTVYNLYGDILSFCMLFAVLALCFRRRSD